MRDPASNAIIRKNRYGAVRDLLRASREVAQSRSLTTTMPAPDPAVNRTLARHTVRAGDLARKPFLDILTQVAVPASLANFWGTSADVSRMPLVPLWPR